MRKTPAVPAQPSLRIRLLGPGEITIDGRVLTDRDWSGRRARSLLLLLAGTPGHRLHREQIIDLIWPDADLDAGANALYKALHALRRTLEPTLRAGRDSACITVAGNTIAIGETVDLWLDVDQYTALLTHAGALPALEQRPTLRSALDLYHGEFVADERYAEWPVPRREALRADYERAVLDLAALDLAAGEPLAAIPWLEALLAQEPTAESAHRALMRAYQSAGQRSLALRQYERCRDLLAREFDDAPEPETTRLADAIRQAPEPVEDDAVIRAASAKYRSLPSVPTRTIGRDDEIADVAAMLRDPATRLVTIIGAGGIGKTRLATEVAASLKPDFPDGAGFVPLAPIRDPNLIYTSIATALQLAEHPRKSTEDVVTAYLETRTYLLVLDNLEQIPKAGRGIARLLEACPGLTVLATSRQPLRIRAEHLYRLDVLDLPENTITTADNLEAVDSTALFVQHLRAQRFGYTPTGDDPAAIASLCVRLDGLPLAIELAAARCYDLSPTEVLAQFNQRARIHVLRDGPQDLPERHQTLQDLVLWSYDLLTEPEQVLFRRLAVFAGGAELDALEAIGGDNAIALANALETRSLVQWTHVDGARRLVILETIREVAAMLLDAQGETNDLHLAHADFLAELIERVDEAKPNGTSFLKWNERLERDLLNLRAALDWSTTGPASAPGLALRIMAKTGNFWLNGQHQREGMHWLELALQLAPPSIEPTRAWAAYWATQVAERLGQEEASREYKALCQRIWRECDDDAEIARSKLLDFLHLQNESRWEETIALCTRVLETGRAHEKYDIVASCLSGIANSQLRLNRSDEAFANLQEALSIVREREDLRNEASLLSNLTGLALSQGDATLAERYAREAESAAQLVGDVSTAAWAVYDRVTIAYLRGNLEEGFSHTAQAGSLFTEVGDQRMVAAVAQTRGSLLAMLDRLPEAIAEFKRAMPGVLEFGSTEDHANLLLETGHLALGLGDAAEALTLFSANIAIRAKSNEHIYAVEQKRLDQATQAARAAMDPAVATSVWSRGEAMSLEDGLDLVREVLGLALEAPERERVAS